MNKNLSLSKFIKIQFGTDLYLKEIILRNQYLRVPLGLSLSPMDLMNEDIQLHFGILQSDDLISCVVIKPISKKVVRLRQMIVKPEFQRWGIGTMLFNYVEKQVMEMGFEMIELNARIPAIPFYEKNGFKQQSSTFIEVNIPHVLMSKRIKN